MDRPGQRMTGPIRWFLPVGQAFPPDEACQAGKPGRQRLPIVNPIRDDAMPLGKPRLFWRLLAGSLILFATAWHVAYLAFDCPLDLAPDEAHYWDWSRHLDWSYYSKGPLVAYLIRAGTALTGSWSRQLTGTDMLAVRLPAVLCGGLLLVSLYCLTMQIYHREDLATAVVALALTLPVVTAGSTLMTIDAPFTCCWGWALVVGYQALGRGSAWAWPATGLLIGLGILAKYTMALWIPSAGLFLLTTPERRRLLLQPGFWVMAGIAAAGCLPIGWWNAQHDWVTLRHVSGQTGIQSQTTGIHWLGPVAYLGGQALLLVGFWLVAWLLAIIAHRPGKETTVGVRYLWWMSAPLFAVVLLVSLKSPVQPNWPVTAYLSGLVLTVGWLAAQLQPAPAGCRRWTAIGMSAGCCLGVLVTGFMHHSEWVHPLLLRLAGPPSADHPFPLRRLDPTCRLRGWRTLAAEVDRLRDRLRDEGVEPELAGSDWTLPGELAFYCQGHPTVYSFGVAMGDRHSQYDWWRPNPLADGDHFQGRTFIVVGEFNPILGEMFERVEPSSKVTHYRSGEPLGRWTVTVCRGFRGWPRYQQPEGADRF
jgi:hypothetical protein